MLGDSLVFITASRFVAHKETLGVRHSLLCISSDSSNMDRNLRSIGHVCFLNRCRAQSHGSMISCVNPTSPFPSRRTHSIASSAYIGTPHKSLAAPAIPFFTSLHLTNGTAVGERQRPALEKYYTKDCLKGLGEGNVIIPSPVSRPSPSPSFP